MAAEPEREHLEEFQGPLGGESVEVLRAEFEYVSAALLSNEESGERRVSVLFGVIAAVTAALALAAEKSPGLHLLWAVAIASGVLFLFGLVTWRRIIHRNVATTEYLNALRRIRARWAWHDPTLASLFAFVPAYQPHKRERPRIWSLGKAGHLETVVATNGLVATVGVTCFALTRDRISLPGALGYGVAAGLFVWWVLMWQTKRLYDDLSKENREDRQKALRFWAEQARNSGSGEAS